MLAGIRKAELFESSRYFKKRCDGWLTLFHDCVFLFYVVSEHSISWFREYTEEENCPAYGKHEKQPANQAQKNKQIWGQILDQIIHNSSPL